MPTTARPAQGMPRGRTPQVLLGAGLCVAAAVALATLAGGLVDGRSGALGALAGGSLALCFFLFGSLVVDMATRMAPQLAMLMALLTYTLQVVAVGVVFLALDASDALGDTVHAGWLAGTVIVATLVWLVAQTVAATRSRQPIYDLPSRVGDRPEASAP